MLHIGIVACSTEGAALCYRAISLEGSQVLGLHDHPEVSLHSHSLARYMKFIDRNDWAGVAELMLSSAEKLAKAGADFLICPDNTIHQAFDLVEHRSPRPWLHIAREVAREARARGFKRLAILGSTGSIGTSTLEVAKAHPERLSVVSLAAGRKRDLLRSLCVAFRPRCSRDRASCSRVRAAGAHKSNHL